MLKELFKDSHDKIMCQLSCLYHILVCTGLCYANFGSSNGEMLNIVYATCICTFRFAEMEYKESMRCRVIKTVRTNGGVSLAHLNSQL